jgi:hypothetical protein
MDYDSAVEFALVTGMNPEEYIRSCTTVQKLDELQELFARMWSLCSVTCGSLIVERKS